MCDPALAGRMLIAPHPSMGREAQWLKAQGDTCGHEEEMAPTVSGRGTSIPYLGHGGL